MKGKIARLFIGILTLMALVIPTQSAQAAVWWDTHQHAIYHQKIYTRYETCYNEYIIRTFYDVWRHEMYNGVWTGVEHFGHHTYVDSGIRVEYTCINI